MNMQGCSAQAVCAPYSHISTSAAAGCCAHNTAVLRPQIPAEHGQEAEARLAYPSRHTALLLVVQAANPIHSCRALLYKEKEPSVQWLDLKAPGGRREQQLSLVALMPDSPGNRGGPPVQIELS